MDGIGVGRRFSVMELIDTDVDEIEIEIESRSDRLKEKARLLWDKFKSNLKAATTVKNIANAVFIIAVSVMCFQQCYSQVNEYLKYSTRLQVSHTFPKSTLWLLPGVTICNNNRVRMAKLVKQTTVLKQLIERVATNITSEYSERKRLETMRLIKEIVDDNVNMSSIIKESPIPKLLDLSRTPMIKDINCNGLWGKQFNCENFRIIESFQAGPCYTMFYLGTLLEALANGKAYDFNTSLLGGKRKINSFGNHEIAEIIVDFEPFEHADFQRDIGGKIVIHSTGHVGSVRDMAHSILPGRSYDIIIKRVMTKRLPPPYKSMCYDYKYYNSPEFTTKQGSLPSIELDKTTCTRNCVIRQTTKACNCWPVEVPYFPHDKLINASETYKMCPWGSEEGQGSYSAALYVDCFKRFHSECNNKCKLGCRTEDYKVHVMSNEWPSKGMFFRVDNENERKELKRLKACCAKISLKYLEFMENRHVMIPSMTLAQLVSNIGGIVSALIGVSAVTIYRYVTRRVFRCKVVSNYIPPGLRVPNKRRSRPTIQSSARLCKQIARVSPAKKG